MSEVINNRYEFVILSGAKNLTAPTFNTQPV